MGMTARHKHDRRALAFITPRRCPTRQAGQSDRRPRARCRRALVKAAATPTPRHAAHPPRRAPFGLPGLRAGEARPPARPGSDRRRRKPTSISTRCGTPSRARKSLRGARTYHVDQLKATLEAAIGDQLEAQKALDDSRRALRDGEALETRARAEAERQAARERPRPSVERVEERRAAGSRGARRKRGRRARRRTRSGARSRSGAPPRRRRRVRRQPRKPLSVRRPRPRSASSRPSASPRRKLGKRKRRRRRARRGRTARARGEEDSGSGSSGSRGGGGARARTRSGAERARPRPPRRG